MEVFNLVWTKVRDGYYDPNMRGVDWLAARDEYGRIVDTASTDRTFYAAVARMLGLLHDIHTQIVLPTSVQQREQGRRADVGLTVREIDGIPTVTAIRPGSAAARAGIEPGMLVKQVSPLNVTYPLTDAAALVARVVAQLPTSGRPESMQRRAFDIVFAGRRDSTMHVLVTRADGTTFDAGLAMEPVSTHPQVESRRLPSGDAYVRWTSFVAPSAKEVASAVRQYRDAPAFVLDLRDNPGGDGSELDAIARLFLDRKTAAYQWGERHGQAPPRPTTYYLGSDGGALYRGPIAILMNERSGSSSELFASLMQESGRARIVGIESCGCVLGIHGHQTLPGGSQLEISARLYLTMHGDTLDRRGVIPNVRAAPSLSDLRAHRDATLDAAETLLHGPSEGAPRRALSSAVDRTGIRFP